MARVSTYLNFPRSTEQAFVFDRSVFGAEFNGPIHRFAEVPAAPCRARCGRPTAPRTTCRMPSPGRTGFARCRWPAWPPRY